MTEKEDPYHLSGKPLPTTRIAPTNYTETAIGCNLGELRFQQVNNFTGLRPG